MKSLFVLLAILVANYGFSQPMPRPTINKSTNLNGLYKWTKATFMTPCSADGTPRPSSEDIVSEVNQKFRILYTTEGNGIIQILDYKDKKGEPTSKFYKYNYVQAPSKGYESLSDNEKSSGNYGADQAYFLIPLETILESSVKEEQGGLSLTTGVLNFPFKYRPQKGKGDFSGAFNFGAAIGIRLPHKSWRAFTHSIVSGYSLSTLVLDSSNVNRNAAKLQTTNNFSAFSFSLGYLVQYERVQAGFFVGWDRLSRINQREFVWQYQGKPWLSLGFGISVFSPENERSSAPNRQTSAVSK